MRIKTLRVLRESQGVDSCSKDNLQDYLSCRRTRKKYEGGLRSKEKEREGAKEIEAKARAVDGALAYV